MWNLLTSTIAIYLTGGLLAKISVFRSVKGSSSGFSLCCRFCLGSLLDLTSESLNGVPDVHGKVSDAVRCPLSSKDVQPETNQKHNVEVILNLENSRNMYLRTIGFIGC